MSTISWLHDASLICPAEEAGCGALQGFGVHYLMNPDPYRGPFGNDGAAYAAQVQLAILNESCVGATLINYDCVI